MLDRMERRSRYRECLELEAQYGQFMSCEGHAHADDFGSEGARPDRMALATRIASALRDGFRALRDALNLS